MRFLPYSSAVVDESRVSAQAASLGIPVADGAPPPSTAYRPYRGRGRGARGPFYRGAMRGGPPRTSMKLDNRPKKLVVKGAPQEALQSVRDWYEVRVAFIWSYRVIV